MEGIRYLNEEERNQTRTLWEEIFPEDTGAFLDYYYSVKTKDNEILAAEPDGRIRSMIQLNPYRLRIGCIEADCAYVIAVATEERYRHQGLMRELLSRAMHDRYEKKQPFLFLIPADEAIYRPFGFRFVMEQNHKKLDPAAGGGYHLIPLREEDRKDAADFSNALLERCAEVYAVRDSHYYQVLQEEARSEDGDVCWIMRDSEKIGLLSYTSGEETEIREPFLAEGYEEFLEEILGSCFPGLRIHAFGLLNGREQIKKDTVMVRPLYLPVLFSGIRAQEDLEFVLRIHDRMISENNGVFVWRVNRRESVLGTEQMPCRQELDMDVSVEALTQLLFGRGSIDEILRTEHCIMTPQARSKWEKIAPLCPVCLNEVV